MGESQWYVIQLFSDPECEQIWWGVRERETFLFLEVVLFWVLGILKVFAWCATKMISYELSVSSVPCQSAVCPCPVISFWLVLTLWSLKLSLTEFLPSPSYSFSTVDQILVTCSCSSSGTNMLLQPLLLEEDDVVYCMSEILWNKLLSAKIKALFNVGTGTWCPCRHPGIVKFVD